MWKYEMYYSVLKDIKKWKDLRSMLLFLLAVQPFYGQPVKFWENK